MFAAYLNSLNESINRRMALVAFGLAIILAIVFNWGVHLKPIGTDFMVVLGNRPMGPASLAVPALFASEAKFTGFIWLVVGIFAAVPVIASTLDKGWLELTFSKGTARWRITPRQLLRRHHNLFVYARRCGAAAGVPAVARDRHRTQTTSDCDPDSNCGICRAGCAGDVCHAAATEFRAGYGSLASRLDRLALSRAAPGYVLHSLHLELFRAESSSGCIASSLKLPSSIASLPTTSPTATSPLGGRSGPPWFSLWL